MRQQRAGCEGGHALGVVLDGLVQLEMGQVDLEDLLPPIQVGPVDGDLAIKPPRPQQRLLHHKRTFAAFSKPTR